jgi:transposase
LKIRHADTIEATVAGFTGTARQPRALAVRLPDGRIARLSQRLTTALATRISSWRKGPGARRWRGGGSRPSRRCRGPVGRQKKDQAANRKKKGSSGGRPVSHDADLYKERNTVERLINKLKAWRGIATRYDKTPASYLAGLHLRASMIWLKELTRTAH